MCIEIFLYSDFFKCLPFDGIHLWNTARFESHLEGGHATSGETCLVSWSDGGWLFVKLAQVYLQPG